MSFFREETHVKLLVRVSLKLIFDNLNCVWRSISMDVNLTCGRPCKMLLLFSNLKLFQNTAYLQVNRLLLSR